MSVASLSQKADRRHSLMLLGPDYVPVYRQVLEVELNQQSRSNRALWIVLALWRESDSGYLIHQVVASDHQLRGETQVVLGELVIRQGRTSTAADAAPLAAFDQSFALVRADLPVHAQAGETLHVTFYWRSGAQATEDYVQFLHFGHEQSGAWWVHDQQPLGPRLPTRLWYDGLADHETWIVPLSTDLMPGQYKVFTGLYRARDQMRVPAHDVANNPFLDARVPLGVLVIN